MTAPLVSLEVFSDIACPWCFIGKRRLEKALTHLPPGTVELHFRAFELQPQLPEDGADAEPFFLEKFGSPERREEMFARVAEAGRGDGIHFDFYGQKRVPNTRLAHRLVKLAAEKAQGAHATEILFRAYFEEALDITQPSVILPRLASGGVDISEFEQRLADGAYVEEVVADERLAQDFAVTGVPCFVANRKYAVSGAQAPEVLEALVKKASEG